MKYILTLESFIDEEVDPVKEGKSVDTTIEKCKAWLIGLGYKESNHLEPGTFYAEMIGGRYRQPYKNDTVWIRTIMGNWSFIYNKTWKIGYPSTMRYPSVAEFTGSLSNLKTIFERAMHIEKVCRCIEDLLQIVSLTESKFQYSIEVNKKMITRIVCNIKYTNDVDRVKFSYWINYDDEKWFLMSKEIDEKQIFSGVIIHLSKYIDMKPQVEKKLEEIKNKPLEEQIEILKHTYRGATKMKKFGF